MISTGAVEDGRIRVADAAGANRLHNKGHLGTPQSGNTLLLTPVEAAFAMDQGRLRVEGPRGDARLEEILALRDGAEVAFLAYRDLRDRGLVVRDEGALHVWARGKTPKQAPWFSSHPYAERDPVPVNQLLERAGDVVSVVDEDGGVLHYRIEEEAPVGNVHPQELEPTTGVVLSDRVMVDGLPDWGAEFVGTPVGDRLFLSFTEAEHLRQRGVLDVPDDLPARARARQMHFDATLPVHNALRAAGVLSHSGFRFGTHLRAYRDDPNTCHAQWLIQCVRPDATLAWSELSRAVRLSHGVRKTFLLGICEDPVRFVSLTWFRP